MHKPPTPSPEDLILEMLREVLARQAQQMGLTPAAPAARPALPRAGRDEPALGHRTGEGEERVSGPSPVPAPEPPALLAEIPEQHETAFEALPAEAHDTVSENAPKPLSRAEVEALERFHTRAAEAPSPSRVPAVLRYLMVGLLVVLVLINLPLLGGTALARALPDRQALIIRDGLVLKGPGPEIYVIEAEHKRWISSLEAFDHYGYSWDVVHMVEQDFLDQFPDGRPLHVLAKCADRPHVYRLENDKRRWIEDIPTLLAEGHVWEDVRTVDCEWLRQVPEGVPIPPEAGPLPEL